MKIFSWMRNKGNGREYSNRPSPESVSHRMVQQPCEEEFSDWPNGLLAIGTFGNNNLKIPAKLGGQDHLGNAPPQDLEEVDRELRVLLNKHISLDGFAGDSEKHDLSVEKFLDSLREDEAKTDELPGKDSHLQVRSSSVVHRGGKDIRLDNKTCGIGKKSMYFLLKKALLCRGGFVPTPILGDPLPDPKLDTSRMEKILRAVLQKKIYPQRLSPKRPSPETLSPKYLDMPGSDGDEEGYEGTCPKSKWVKTDSEYIVLEI